MMAPGTFSREVHRGGEVAGFLSIWMTPVISPMLYGLVHVLAWGGRFPTPLEQLLWQVSSLVVTCSGLVVVFVVLIRKWSHDSGAISGKRIDMFMADISAIMPFAQTLASGFLIIESFRQLSFLDSAAYQLPSWSNYWPHFS